MRAGTCSVLHKTQFTVRTDVPVSRTGIASYNKWELTG